ncbi:MAG: hypothetical protein KGI00_03245 [Candidatus Micrarchaeota archaeon]|nr:hypothetical protein [Planctomycetota bacterium]MDE1849721.1 hypothetical protein [Candidatus Micrarchaeota archaeon]
MSSLDLIYLIVFLTFPLFLIGYYAPKLKDKEKLEIKTLAEFGGSFSMGLLVYVPSVVLIYMILAFGLNVYPEGAISYQTSGGVFYFLNHMTYSLDNFISYLTGTTPNGTLPGFFPDIIMLVIFPIILLIIIRLVVGKFSKQTFSDFVIYTSSVFIPSITIISAYLLVLLLNRKVGIYLLNFNLAGYLILGVLFFLVMFSYLFYVIKTIKVVKFIRNIRSEKIHLYLILEIAILFLFLVPFVTYLPYIYTIYNQPSITNVASHLMHSDVQAQISTSNRNTNGTYGFLGISSTSYLDVTGNLTFKNNGVSFVILPKLGAINYQNLSHGLLPNYTIISCGSIYLSCNNSITDNEHRGYVLLSKNRSNTTNVGINFTMSFISTNTINRTVTVIPSSNQSCINQNCTYSILIKNYNYSKINFNFIFSPYRSILQNVSLSYINDSGSSSGICQSYDISTDCRYNLVNVSYGKSSSLNYVDGIQVLTYTQYSWVIRGDVPANSNLIINLTMTYNQSVSQ